MKTVMIVQARIGSKRFPGKIMKPIMGRPILYYAIERLKQVKHIDEIILATTLADQDDVLEEFSKKNEISFFRGSENDVLGRFYEAAVIANADLILRCNSDCPLIDSGIVDKVIETQRSYEQYDYVSNILKPSYPIGMHAEVFKFNALERAFYEAKDPLEREHVTPYIYRRPNLFKLKNVAHAKDFSKYRLTLDYPEDLQLIEAIYSELYQKNNNFGMDDAVKFLDSRPDLHALNQHFKKDSTV